MLSWLRRPREKYSLENLRFLYDQLLQKPEINSTNKHEIVEILRTIAELMIWGDQHNDSFFYFFCEKNILSHFLRILSQRVDSQVNVQLLQTLSIMIANFSKQTSMYYLLSNNHINDLIVHRFDFSDEEVLAYYISFLKTLSLKLDTRTLQFFYNERLNEFPLYTHAIQFFHHPEAMVRIAVRTLTLNVFKVDDPQLRAFILDRSAVPYFCNLVWYCRDQLLNINQLFIPFHETCDKMSPIQAVDLRVRQNASRTKILSELDEQIDFFHYIMEILRLGIGELNQVLVDQLLAHFIVPVLLGSFLPVSPTHTPLVAKSLALHILTQVFLIFTDRPLVNSILTCLLHDHPPAVTLELFTRAPQHPVFDSVALSEVMYISVKESYDRIERGKKCNNTPTFDDDDDDDDDDDEDTLNSNRAHSHRVPPSGVGPLFQPSECMENWSASATSNPCRQAFLSFLDSDNDRVAFGASSVLLAIIKNSEIDSLLLERIRLCPQRISKRRKLLNNILCESSSANIPHHMESTIHDTSFDEDDDSEDNECIENQSLTHHQIDEEDCDLVNHEQSEFDHDDAKSNGTCIDNDQTRYETRCDSSSSPSSAAATTAAAAGTLSPSSALVASDLSPSSSSPPSSAAASSTAAAAVTAAPETNTDPTYDDELFNILIGVLDCQHYRSTSLLSLVSQLLVELFCVDASSIVSDTTSVTHNNTSLSHSTQSCLKASHSALLDAKRRDAEDQVRQCQAYSEFIAASEEMSVGAFGSLFLDVFEKLFLTSFPSSTKLLSLIADGNSLFIDCNIVFDTEDIANTLALQATAPLAMCFSLRRLALKAEQRCDDMFPVQQPHSYTMKKNQIITLVNREVLPCIAQFGSIRERKLLLLDDEFLLLADAMPHTTKERRAIIFAAILLRHVEIHSAIGVTKMTLNISCRGIGAMTPPHSHCHHHHHHTSKTETASTIYIFALQFDSVDNAEMAFNTLNRFRSRRRLQVLSQIQLFLRSEEAYKTTHIDTNA